MTAYFYSYYTYTYPHVYTYPSYIYIYTLRSLYKLPVLLVDDFADVTPELVRQAYVEALYRVEDWEFTRITEKHWIGILQEVLRCYTITTMCTY